MNAFTNHANLALRLTYDQVATRYDDEYRVAWSIMKPEGRPCFNPVLLNELNSTFSSIQQFKGQIFDKGEFKKVDYHVMASGIPGVFNLGGDLNTFHEKIVAGDRDTLQYYADLCIENIWMLINRFESPLTTISLLQGQALGGGFECALTSDVIVAEKSVKLGLPEIIFNLFPGMGALSFISRKIGMKKAEEIVMSGKLYTATELYDLGVVDVLAEDGQGEQAMYEWIARNSKQRNGYMAVQRAKSLINPVTKEELNGITSLWVDAALQLEQRDLRMMKRLVQAQTKLS